MVIHKSKAQEDKTDQHWHMVIVCINHWRRLNNDELQYYPDVMNMIIYRINNEHNYYVGLTYHFNPNKW